MDKRITLSDQAIDDLKIVAANAGTNSKSYIERMIIQHLKDLGYPKKKKNNH